MATPSTHRNPYWAALRWSTHDLGPQLHSLKTKVCSLDSLWGPVERYLGVCCLLYLLNLSSSLHLRALTCSDLGCTVEAGPTHSSSGPAASPSVACRHRLSWDLTLWQHKVKTNLLSLAPGWEQDCSSLGPQQAGQRPWLTLSSLILPTLQTLAGRAAFPWLGES